MTPQEKSRSPLTPAQLDQLRQALEQRRAELRRKSAENLRVGTHVEEALVEAGDLASQETTSAELVGLAEQQRELLEEIEAALERMDRGTYGLSAASGQPIPFPRLVALPWARNDAHEEEAREQPRR